VYLDEKGVIDGSEDVALHHHPLHLPLLLDVLLLHGLEGEELPAFLLAHQDHLGVGALADHREHGVVVQGRNRLHLQQRL
jgi:hypothetical protein